MSSFRYKEGQDYSFVLIPAISSKPLSQLTEKDGGLEADSTQRVAKAHFTSPGGLDGAIQVAAAKHQIEKSKEEGTSPATGGLEMTDALESNLAGMGAQVEIMSLALPQALNDYIGVSMYTDANAQVKQLGINQRATELARTCGYPDAQVYGDAFVSRYYDNESCGASEVDPWVRLDLKPEELDQSSDFVKETARMNSGKNMGAYTSSGSLAQSLKQLQTGGGSTITDKGTNRVENEATSVQWIQTDNDLEVKYKFNTVVITKQLKIKIKSSKLLIVVPDGLFNVLFSLKRVYPVQKFHHNFINTHSKARFRVI